MRNSLLSFSMQRPTWVFVLLLLVTLLFAALIPLIKIDTDPENMLSEQQVDRLFHNQVKKDFQLHDLIVVGVVNEQGIFNPKSLQNLSELADKTAQIKGVIAYDLMALSTVDNVTQSDDGALLFEWLMRAKVINQAAADRIAAQVERLPLLQNTLVSGDEKAAAIYVPIERKDESHRIAQEIEQIIEQLDGDDDYHITGLPVAEDTFGYQMFVQMGISAPLAALMICVLMWWYFRNLKFIAAPMVVAMATCLIVMGLMIGLGYTVHIMSSMIPIFLMPIAVVDSIHIMSEFAETYRAGKDKTQVIKQVVGHLFKPMLFTSVTSAVGFASLMLTPIPPVQVFGAFVAFGIFLAFILTIMFVPAYLAKLKPESLANLQEQPTDYRKLQQIGLFSVNRRKFLLLLFTAIVVVGVWGVSQIQINDNPVRWFKSNHKIRVADRVLNQHFAGTYNAYLVFDYDTEPLEIDLKQRVKSINDDGLRQQVEQQLAQPLPFSQKMQNLTAWAEEQGFNADDEQRIEAVDHLLEMLDKVTAELHYFQKPQALQYIEQLQQALQQGGLVGKSNALTEVVKTVNRELHSGQNRDYQLPKSQSAVAQSLLQYQSSHRPQDLWHFVNKDYTQTVVWIQLKSGDNQDMSQVIQQVDKYIAQHPLADGIQIRWAGKAYLNQVWQQEMVAGMLFSLLSAFVVVFVMMVFLFRSVWFGAIAMLPLTVTIVFIYGLIGWVGKDYDMPIAVLSSLTLGLSVDFAIHFLQRFRDLYAEHQDFTKTMQLMFGEPATAISRNAVVIALGFTPLLLAPLVPYISVGFFLASIMAVSAIVTLLLLPAVLSLLQNILFNKTSRG